MEGEDNGSIGGKNDDTNQSITPNNFVSEINYYDSHDEIEKDNISSNFIGFPNETDEIDEKNLYLIMNGQNSNTPSKKRFKVLRNKRGRERKKIKVKNKDKSHNKYGKDNMIRKCQISYFNFIIDFINNIISLFKIKLKQKRQFIYLDYDLKRAVNKTQRVKFHIYSIEDIIKRNKISRKYKKSSPTSNQDLYEEIKKLGKPEIDKIFKKKFIFFFKNIYQKSIRKFNLKDLDKDFANLTIEIPEDVELYKDLLDKNRGNFEFEEYKSLMDKCIENYFEINNLFCTRV